MLTHVYWFPAKTSGWGWGIPVRWEGWAVLAVYVMLLVAAGAVFRPDRHRVRFLLSVVVISAALVAVCWLTGEPPHWRS
ncbi:hypothetical protein [Pararobbsia silviterrae]